MTSSRVITTEVEYVCVIAVLFMCFCEVLFSRWWISLALAGLKGIPLQHRISLEYTRAMCDS